MFRKLISVLGLAILLSSSPAPAATNQPVKDNAVRFQSEDESHTGVKRTYHKAKHKMRRGYMKTKNAVKTEYNKAKSRVTTGDEMGDTQERK